MRQDDLRRVLDDHAAWLRGGGGQRANLWDAHLGDADLRGADLRDANLQRANLWGTNLRDADLRDANLQGAYLRCADLLGASLQGAYLEGVNFRGANLRCADLRGADLRGANLRCANLRDANLGGAYLEGVNFRGAYLRDTCLDPAAEVPLPSREECEAAGLEVDAIDSRDRVYGWRTSTSRHVGSTDYRRGGWYVAPWFSVDVITACHPGIYLSSEAWCREQYGAELVRCWCYRDELIHADGKWRAKRIFVLPQGVTR